MGQDCMPKEFYQTFISSVGIILGVFINAYIFGEIVMIFDHLDRDTKEFQSKLAATNTAMINLGLPFQLQQSVRHDLFKTAPSLKTQIQLQVFLKEISPSMKFRVTQFLYKSTI